MLCNLIFHGSCGSRGLDTVTVGRRQAGMRSSVFPQVSLGSHVLLGREVTEIVPMGFGCLLEERFISLRLLWALN